MTANASADLKRMLGEPGCAIRSMLLPIMVSYLVFRINSFTDAAWCSGLGPDAVHIRPLDGRASRRIRPRAEDLCPDDPVRWNAGRGPSILQSLRKSQISALTNFARNCLALVLLCFCGSISPDAIYWSLVLAEAIEALAMLGLAKIAVKRCRVECYRCGCDKVIIIRSVRGAIRCGTTLT